MTTFSKMTFKALLVATLLPLMAIADGSAPANDDRSDTPVIVIRGSQVQIQGGTQKAVKAGKRAAPSSQQEGAVIVMRPASGSFMRGTTRLAAEADAREERAAQEEARETNLRLSEALRAVEDAAKAVQAQARSKRYLVVAPIGRGVAIDPKTGQSYGGGQGGMYIPLKDPKKGRVSPEPSA
jgi:hypothetical protein